MSTQVQVLLAINVDLASTVNAQITIEAEYGSTTINGSRYTAAHHGANCENPAPCLDAGLDDIAEDGDTVLVSHLDLDTIGGIARAIGHPIADHQGFWKLSAYVDVNGPHKLGQSGAEQEDVDRLYAYWAWAQSNRGPRRENDQIHDVTSEVATHLNVIHEILRGDAGLLKAGQEFKEAGERLNEESFVEVHAGTIVRVGPAFVNHIYTTPQGEVCKAVVSFNTKTGSITLSFADKEDGRNAAKIMQEAFGPDAGGHAGIAGSPRGTRMKLADLATLLALL
jgi:hypothetical protein